MEMFLLCGIQASGKTTYYLQNYARTHVHCSQDMMGSRHREFSFITTCLTTRMPFVIDYTNVKAETRARYIALAKSFDYRIIGRFFDISVADAVSHNSLRSQGQRVPDVAIAGTQNRLDYPTVAEGYDELYYHSFDGKIDRKTI